MSAISGSDVIVPNHYVGDESQESSKSPNNVASTFSSAVHLLPNDLRFEQRDVKLISCHGPNLSLLHPCGFVSFSDLQTITSLLREFRILCTGVWDVHLHQTQGGSTL